MSDILYSGRHLMLRHRNGWEYVQRPNCSGVVAIIALSPNDELILVAQHRPPVDRCVIELPAGLSGDIAGQRGENPLAAAQRELTEETGYRAGRMEWLYQGPSSAGMSDEVVQFIRAHELSRVGPGGGDESESITVHEVALDRVEDWLTRQIADGVLVDPKVLTGLYLLRQPLR